MDLLPDLAIEEDIEKLGLNDNDEDDLTMEEMEGGPDDKLPVEPIQNSEPKVQHTDIFIDKPTTKNTKKKLKTINEEEDVEEKPKKKKKEISEKQRAHLDRIRAKALENKRIKSIAKAKAVQEVKDSFKKKKKVPKTKTDLQFEEKIEEDKQENTKNEKATDFSSFHYFMENMSKFENMKREYNHKTQPKPIPVPKPVPKPQPKKPAILKVPIVNDPYADWF